MTSLPQEFAGGWRLSQRRRRGVKKVRTSSNVVFVRSASQMNPAVIPFVAVAQKGESADFHAPMLTCIARQSPNNFFNCSRAAVSREWPAAFGSQVRWTNSKYSQKLPA